MNKKDVEIQVRPLHHFSIFEAMMPDYNEIKEDVKSYIYSVKPEVENHITPENNYPLTGIGPHEQRHKRGLLESNPNLFDDTSNPIFNKLIEFCHSTVANIILEVNKGIVDTSDWKIGFHDSWFHITKDGGYHDYHTHYGTPWSGIFYVDIGDSNFLDVNGVNRFYSPMNHIPMILGLNALSITNFDIEPVDGKLVITPGFIPHCATPYKGNKDRIVVAFNTVVENSKNLIDNNWSRSQESFYKDNGDSNEKI